jgi:hypothetical protein
VRGMEVKVIMKFLIFGGDFTSTYAIIEPNTIPSMVVDMDRIRLFFREMRYNF